MLANTAISVSRKGICEIIFEGYFLADIFD